MKKIKFLLTMFTFFICMSGVNAAAPSSFKVIHGGEWDKQDSGFYKIYAGLQGSWLIGYFNGKEQEVFCVEPGVRAPERTSDNSSCVYDKTEYYIDSPVITNIMNYNKPTVNKYSASSTNSTWSKMRYYYHLRKGVIDKYLKDNQNSYLFTSNKTGAKKRVNQVINIKPGAFTNSTWNRIDNETDGQASWLLDRAKKSTNSNENKSSLKAGADDSKGKCSNGTYVLSPVISVTGNSINWEKYSISTSYGEVVNESVSGGKLTFNIRAKLSDLKQSKKVNVSISAESSTESSRFYVYEARYGCTDERGLGTGSIQRVLLSEPDPTVLKTSVTVTLDPSVCNVTDYSIDAACTNCYDNGKSADRSSYIIQDTDSWEGILRSDDSNYMCDAETAQQQNVKSYYKKKTSCGVVYCREEVKLVFPNANDTPTVERGRYFTVHSPFRDDDKLVKQPYSADYNEDVTILNENKYDHNWGSIKVIKTRECRMKNASNEKSCLQNSDNSLKFKDDVKITLTYEGKNEDGASSDDKKELSKYGDKLKEMNLEPEPEGEFGSGSSHKSEVISSYYKNADGTIKSSYKYVDTKVTTYKLEDGKFRYVLKGDGIYVSEEDVKGKNEGTYIDLGISAVPVSSKNKVFTDEDATLSLSFKLDSDMHLSESFIEKNNYLPTCTCTVNGDKSNIYSYTISKGKLSEKSVTLPNSSKEEKDKVSTLGTSACAKLHECVATPTGLKNCKTITNDENGSSVGIKSCIKNRIKNKLGDDSNNCYTKSLAKEDGNSNYVCPVNVDPGIPSADPVNPPDCPGCVCKVSNGTYYGKDGSVISKEQYEKECKSNPTGSNTSSSGSSEVIYRTIDLTNPFPGESGKNRLTGVNWCQASDVTGNIVSCKWDKSNTVVNDYILNNRNVKGDAVYSLEPLYEVTLTSDKIEEIRDYNSTHSYDDFTLVCDAKTGENCKSKFVDTYVTRKSGG